MKVMYVKRHMPNDMSYTERSQEILFSSLKTSIFPSISGRENGECFAKRENGFAFFPIYISKNVFAFLPQNKNAFIVDPDRVNRMLFFLKRAIRIFHPDGPSCRESSHNLFANFHSPDQFPLQLGINFKVKSIAKFIIKLVTFCTLGTAVLFIYRLQFLQSLFCS